MSEKKELRFQLSPVLVADIEVLPPVSFSLTDTLYAENRMQQAQFVNVSTYTSLDHAFNSAYRELKAAYAIVTYQIADTNKRIEEIKAEIILEKYPQFVEGKPASYDNADRRKAFTAKDPTYQAALGRLNELESAEKLIEGRIKTMEKYSAMIRKQMDIIIRSGVPGGGR